MRPEQFAEQLKDHPGLSKGYFFLDGVHSVQELLKEGMNPRMSGLGATPRRIACGAMVAVGIFHFADPEMAYLDGVELASVLQPRLGADWAGLCGGCRRGAGQGRGAVGCLPDGDEAGTRQRPGPVLPVSAMRVPTWKEEEFVPWWYYGGGWSQRQRESSWVGFNPMYFIMPLLGVLSNKPEKFMQVLVGTPAGNWYENAAGGHGPAAAIGGAILAALGGAEIFPARWLKWAQPKARRWLGITKVVKARVGEEQRIVSVIDKLQKKKGSTSLLVEKISGCLLAGAIGNAMGSPVEGRFYTEIDKMHPGGVKTVLNPKCLESEDDNQMAALLVETYLRREGAAGHGAALRQDVGGKAQPRPLLRAVHGQFV